MSQHTSPSSPGPSRADPEGRPEAIVVIRHAERPTEEDEAPFGVDIQGRRNDGSLTPKGWQRAGALPLLFRTPVAALGAPDRLYAPKYKSPSATVNHRTYQTILPLSLQLNRRIHCSFTEKEEEGLANAIMAGGSGAALVCWDHHRIPTIASFIPVVNRELVPRVWPDDKYDMIWLFSLTPDSRQEYLFTRLPQLLLAGDSHI